MHTSNNSNNNNTINQLLMLISNNSICMKTKSNHQTLYSLLTKTITEEMKIEFPCDSINI